MQQENSAKDGVTRREFLLPWIRSRAVDAKPAQHIERYDKGVLSRRAFLKLIFVMCTALGATTSNIPASAESMNSAEQSPLPDQNFTPLDDPEEALGPVETSLELAQTAIETSLMRLGNLALEKVMDYLRMPHGDAYLTDPKVQEELIQLLTRGDINKVLKYVILPPIGEETLARLAPSMIVDHIGASSQAPWVGILSSLLFAFSHNFVGNDEMTGDPILSTKIPISQFIVGVFLWRLMREKGFSHALMSHTLYNVESLAIAKLLLETYPGNNTEAALKILRGSP